MVNGVVVDPSKTGCILQRKPLMKCTLNGSNYLESIEHDFRIYNTALSREFYCFSVVQRLASFEDASLQGMAGKKQGSMYHNSRMICVFPCQVYVFICFSSRTHLHGDEA
jgi:hypothetical protein